MSTGRARGGGGCGGGGQRDESDRGQAGVEGKGKEETAGRYSFAVPAVVIYLKPLAVNISPSFIQRHGSSSGGRGSAAAEEHEGGDRGWL